MRLVRPTALAEKAPDPQAPAAAFGSHAATAEQLLTATEVSRILGVRPKRVYELGIPFIQLSSRSKRWRRVDLDAWIHERARNT